MEKPSQAEEEEGQEGQAPSEPQTQTTSENAPLAYGVMISVKSARGRLNVSTSKLCLIMGTSDGSVFLKRNRGGFDRLSSFSYTNEILKSLRDVDPEYLGGLAPVSFAVGPESIGSVGCFVGMRYVRSYELLIPEGGRGGVINHATLGIELIPGEISEYVVRYRVESARLLKACAKANETGGPLPQHPKPAKAVREAWAKD